MKFNFKKSIDNINKGIMIHNQSNLGESQIYMPPQQQQIMSDNATVPADAQQNQIDEPACRNPIILFLFFVICILMISWTMLSGSRGNDDRILSPIRNKPHSSASHTTCYYGYEFSQIHSFRKVDKQFGYLYITTLMPPNQSNLLTYKTCLTACPTFPINTNIKTLANNKIQNIVWDQFMENPVIVTEDTNLSYYRTFKVANRLCVPYHQFFTTVQQAQKYAKEVILPFRSQLIASIFLDISNHWPRLFIVVIFVIIISLFFALFMRKCFRAAFFISLVLVDGALLGIGLLFFHNFGLLTKDPLKILYLGVPSTTYSLQRPILGVISIIIFIFMIIHHILNRDNIRQGLKMIQYVGDFIKKADPRLSIYRIAYFILIFTFIFSVFVAALAVSVYEFQRQDNYTFRANLNLSLSQAYGFGTIWIIFSIIQFVEAYYSLTYYYSIYSAKAPVQKRIMYFNLIQRSILGDIVLASIMKYIIHFIFVLRLIANHLINLKNTQKCWCNRNVFTQLANFNPILQVQISDRPLIESAVKNANLNWKYFQQLKSIRNGKMIFFFIRLAISLITVMISYFFISFNRSLRRNIISVPHQLLLILIITYTLTGIWLSYYTTAFDPIYMCYINNRREKKNTYYSSNQEAKQSFDAFLRQFLVSMNSSLKINAQDVKN